MNKINIERLNIEHYSGKNHKKALLEEINIAKRIAKGSVLDVGFGNLRLLKAIYNRIELYVGIDKNKETYYTNLKNFLSDKVRLYNEDILYSKYKNEFDVVYACWSTVATFEDGYVGLENMVNASKNLIFFTLPVKNYIALHERVDYYVNLNDKFTIDPKTQNIESEAWNKVRAYTTKQVDSLIAPLSVKVVEKGILHNVMHYRILKAENMV